MNGLDDDTAQTLDALVQQLGTDGAGGLEELLHSLPEPARGVLVVDDTVETLRVLVATLSGEGYEVRPANGGAQALEAIKAQRPELVLLDVRMPGVDGFEVCRTLRASEATRNIPVLFLSATGDDVERLRCFEVGGVDFIPKPFQREELLARVRTHLELTRLRSRLEEQVQERTASLKNAILRIAEEYSEKELLEGALQKAHRRYRHLVENVPLGIFQLSLQGHFKYANRALLRQFGCAGQEDLIRDHYEFRRSWEDPREFDDFLQQSMQRGILDNHPVRLVVGGHVRCFRYFTCFDSHGGLVNGISVPERGTER